jgi:hypothetical protein
MNFNQIASYAWAIYRECKDEEYVVKPSMPILYFGDYHGYGAPSSFDYYYY